MAVEKVREEIKKLIAKGTMILYLGALKSGNQEFEEVSAKGLEDFEKSFGNFKKQYQVWYPRAYRCVRIFAPERLEEFEQYYTGNKKMKNLSYLDAGITHYLQGIVTTRTYGDDVDYYGRFTSGMETQINILQGIDENLDDTLFNIESEIHFGIFRSEIDIAKELNKSKQLRAAGAIAGVVIEEHLKLTCHNRDVKFRKKNPSISDYNEALKKDKVIDTVTWRLITRCADIRNYCVHSKERGPKPDEVDDIIRGAEKIISEVH